MVNLDEGFIQDLWKAAQKRFSSPKSIARAGAADVAATAIATTPAQSARPALPPQPAPIVRQVAAPVNLNPLQQVAAPFKKVRDIVRQLNPAKPSAGSLPQGKPGGSVVTASKPGAVTPSAKLASGISNTGGSSVATTTGSGQVSTTGANVRTPGGSLEKAGKVIDVQARLSGTPEVKRIPSNKVTSFKPSVSLTGGGGAAVSGSTASNVLGALKYVPHVAAAAIGLNAGPVADGTLKGKDLNTPPRPEATKTPEKKPEVQQVVTKKRVVPPVKQPERPRVDPEVQRYRDLVKKGKRLEAERLGRDIHQRCYGAPAFRPTKTAQLINN